jgi:serine/threonine-protein kinase
MTLAPQLKRVSKLPGLGAIAAIVLSTSSGLADASAPNDAVAEALFAEAKALMLQGNDQAACPKLAESQRLDPGTGTLLMLALCHERTGRTASAWTEYRDALVRSEQDQREDRVDVARRHIASLEAQLVRVRLRVAPDTAALPGFELRADGDKIAPTVWLAPMPIDPGTHSFAAFAQGQRIWSQTIVVERDTTEQEVVVPPIKVAAPPPVVAKSREPAPQPVEPAHHPTSALKIAAVAAAAVALAGVTVGAIYGVRAVKKSDVAHQSCNVYPCSSAAETANAEAKSAAVVSNIAFGVAGAGGIGALTFILLDASPTPSSASTARSRPTGFMVGWEHKW